MLIFETRSIISSIWVASLTEICIFNLDSIVSEFVTFFLNRLFYLFMDSLLIQKSRDNFHFTSGRLKSWAIFKVLIKPRRIMRCLFNFSLGRNGWFRYQLQPRGQWIAFFHLRSPFIPGLLIRDSWFTALWILLPFVVLPLRPYSISTICSSTFQSKWFPLSFELFCIATRLLLTLLLHS